MKADFLTRMTVSSRQRVEVAIARHSEAEMRRLAEAQRPAAPLLLSDQGFDLIAEVKRRSPSMGELAGAGLSATEQAQCYADAGAAAISVLTEPEQFSGTLVDLERVATEIPSRPALRKDFLVSPYQILEARAAGAGGVLLIAAMLNAAELRNMLQATLELGMFALVEAFDSADLNLCVPVMEEMTPVTDQAEDGRRCRMLIGVNCRNLRNLQVDFTRFETLAKELPENMPWVAESGVTTPGEAGRIAELGYRVALVGTALMRAAEPAGVVRALISAGRHQGEPDAGRPEAG